MNNHTDKGLNTQQLSRVQVGPFDFFSDLLLCFSNQIIHMMICFNGKIDPAILRDAIMQASITEPVTRCRLVCNEDMLWWEPCIGIDVNNFFTIHRTVNTKGLLAHSLSIPIDPYLGPMIQVVLIQAINEREEDILIINAHHAAMDGKGLKDFTGLILDFYQSLYSDIEFNPPQSPLCRRNISLSSEYMSAASYQKSKNTDISWSGGISVPCNSLEYNQPSYSLLTLSPTRMKMINTLRKTWGITLNDLMLAVVARACAEITGNSQSVTVPLLNTIDLRRYLSDVPQRSVHNFSTAFEISIKINHQEKLKETAIRVHYQMNLIKLKAPGIEGVQEVEELFALGNTAARKVISDRWEGLHESGNRTPLFSNTGIIPDYPVSPGLKIKFATLLPTHSLPPGFFFLLSTFNEMMTISSTYFLPAYDNILIQKMYSEIDSMLPGFCEYPGMYCEI